MLHVLSLNKFNALRMEDPSSRAVSPSIRTSLNSSKIHYLSEIINPKKNNIMNLTLPWSINPPRNNLIPVRSRDLLRARKRRNMRASRIARKSNVFSERNA
jgi:hypothetical protein